MTQSYWLLALLLAFPVQAADLLLLDKATVRRYSPQTAQVLQQAELSGSPAQIWSTEGVLYLLDSQENLLRAYDTKTLQALKIVSIPAYAADLVVDREFLWTIHSNTFKLTQIRRSDLVLVKSISLSQANPYLFNPELTLVGSQLWITNPVTGTLTALDSRTLTLQNTFSVGEGNTYLMPLGSKEDQIYTTLRDQLYVIDRATGKVLRQVPLRDPAFIGRSITVSQLLISNDRVYAVEPTADQIIVLDRSTLTRLPTLKFNSKLGTVHLDPKGRLYIPLLSTGELIVQVNQTPLKLKLTAEQVWWLED